MLLIALACSLPAWSSATTYDINFTLGGGTPAPTAGSFTYDPTVGFSNFVVDWFGQTFDLTSTANAGLFIGGTGCNTESNTPQYAFLILTKALTGCSVLYFWSGGGSNSGGVDFTFSAVSGTNADHVQVSNPFPPDGTLEAGGSWTLTQVSSTSTPEPATLGVTLLAGLALLGRKRRAKTRSR
jgi:hypothetical protein